MKKILSTSTISSSYWTSFTTDNVSNKSHPFVKLLDSALSRIGIGTYSLQYSASNSMSLISNSFGKFSIALPTVSYDRPYFIYFNSETKELCGFQYILVVTTGQTAYLNAQRGRVVPTNSTFTGGFLAIKFTNEKIIGCSHANGGYASLTSSQSYYPSVLMIGSPLPENRTVKSTPTSTTTIKYCRKPILYNVGLNTTTSSLFLGEYFESIYDIEQYYVGALKSSDNKKFIIDGKMFDVDDATDIETI